MCWIAIARIVTVTVCLAALASAAVRAGINEWTYSDPIEGPGEGGDVVIDPQTPTTLYIATSEGLFRSTDSGSQWSATGDGASVHTLAIDPLDPTTLYTAHIGDGVFKSTDGGDSWSEANAGLTDTYVHTLVIDPQTTSILYAATTMSGVFKSTDGAATWSEFSSGLPWDVFINAVFVLSLAIDPQTPTTLYAGVNNCLRSCGLDAGVYKTTDGGVSWEPTGRIALPYVQALAIDPQSPTTLYASVPGDSIATPPLSWVFKSTDGGDSWSGSNDGFAPGITDARGLAVDGRTTPATVYLGTSFGVYESTDGGARWRQVGLSGVTSLAIDPEVPARVYAGTGYRVHGRLFLRQRRTLSLQDGRFTVEVDWRDYQGETGQASVAAVFPETAEGAALRTHDSAVLRYSNPSNWELLVKVLDGRALNDHFWVFLAAATDLELTTTITDTRCGGVRTYVNPLGLSAPAVTDTAAFGDCTAPVRPLCVPGQTTLCLGDRRFQVDVSWRTSAGSTGSARPASMPRAGPAASDDSGLFFFFFDEDNWELLVKVLDGCAINDRFWVFSAAATSVEYTLRVTDTETGAVNEYVNPLGNAADALTDTQAFATCP